MKQKRENFELKENNNNDLVQLEARSRMGYGVWNMDERFCAPKIVFRISIVSLYLFSNVWVWRFWWFRNRVVFCVL